LIADQNRAAISIQFTELLANLHRAQTEDGNNFDILIYDQVLEESHQSLQLFEYLMNICSAFSAHLFVGAGNNRTQAITDIEAKYFAPEFMTRWNQLRTLPQANSTYVVAPRFLVRLPYGKSTNPIDAFPFEELMYGFNHAELLWANGAYLLLLAALTKESTKAEQGQSIENLPLLVRVDEDGDKVITPCAEYFITQTQINQMETLGFTLLQSVKNANQIFISRWVSFAQAE
jgi:type VI secretion system protein ImpC